MSKEGGQKTEADSQRKELIMKKIMNSFKSDETQNFICSFGLTYK